MSVVWQIRLLVLRREIASRRMLLHEPAAVRSTPRMPCGRLPILARGLLQGAPAHLQLLLQRRLSLAPQSQWCSATSNNSWTANNSPSLIIFYENMSLLYLFFIYFSLKVFNLSRQTCAIAQLFIVFDIIRLTMLQICSWINVLWTLQRLCGIHFYI